MVKKKFAGILSMIVLMLFSFVGCSTDPISKIEVLNNAIKTEYVVGEEVKIDEFSLKITLKSNRTKVYEIEEDMVTIGEVNNKVLGVQNMPVTVDYNGMEFAFVVSVNFVLPEDVKMVIMLINELPETKKIGFANESQMELIKEQYNLLDDFHKSYVVNYNKYVEASQRLLTLTNEYITSEFINERFILKTNVDNVLYSLNEYDYDEEEWDEILKIYDECISELYKNENHESIHSIANSAIRNIYGVLTINDKNINELKKEKIGEVNNYFSSLELIDYSHSNYVLLSNIVAEFDNKISSLDNAEEIENLYNKTMAELESIETLDEEVATSLSTVITNKLNIVRNMLIELDINNYSDENKSIIINYYNECLENVRNADSEAAANEIIRKFEYNVSKVYTIAEEKNAELNTIKTAGINRVNELYSSVNLYEYVSKNRKIISTELERAIATIKASTSINEVNDAISRFIEIIHTTPTIEEEAILNLPLRIEEAINRVDTYITSLDTNSYSEESWKLISKYALETKNYFRENITISTSNFDIDREINSLKAKVEEILTIEAQKVKVLEETRTTGIKELNEYQNNLRAYMFEDGIYSIVITRINSSKNIINGLESAESIVKLVNDTIQAIEDAKK